MESNSSQISRGQITGCSATEILQSCKHLLYWSQCKMASDMSGILHNGKQIKKKWTWAMVLPFNPAGNTHPADEAETLLGSSTAHSCCWSRCWAAATQGSLPWAIAALRNEDKLGHHLILVFWILLVPLALEGMGTARQQAQHLGCLLGVTGDYTVEWISTIIFLCLGQCNKSRVVKLHSPISCMAAAHW